MTRQQRRLQATIYSKDGEAVQGIVTGAANMLAMAGLVAALAEARLIDPRKVADWVDVMASSGVGEDQGPIVQDCVKSQLDGLSLMLRSMATMPNEAGRA